MEYPISPFYQFIFPFYYVISKILHHVITKPEAQFYVPLEQFFRNLLTLNFPLGMTKLKFSYVVNLGTFFSKINDFVPCKDLCIREFCFYSFSCWSKCRKYILTISLSHHKQASSRQRIRPNIVHFARRSSNSAFVSWCTLYENFTLHITICPYIFYFINARQFLRIFNYRKKYAGSCCCVRS